jgi:hypothetical protein
MSEEVSLLHLYTNIILQAIIDSQYDGKRTELILAKKDADMFLNNPSEELKMICDVIGIDMEQITKTPNKELAEKYFSREKTYYHSKKELKKLNKIKD